MTGYLQRLAASVSQPQPRLHPLVGSVFSGERQEVAAPDLLQNDALAPTDDPNLISTTRTVSDSPDGAMHRRDLAADDRVEQHGAIASPAVDSRIGRRRIEPEIFHPLLPSKIPEVDVSAMLPETVPGDVASAQSGLQHDRRDTSSVGAARMAHVRSKTGRPQTGEMRPQHRQSVDYVSAPECWPRSPVTPANRPELSSRRRRGSRRRATTSKSISVV